MTESWMAFHSLLVDQLGWTLLHFLWQGALGALVLGIILRAMREHSAQSRYLAALFCLLFLAFAPVITLLNTHIHGTGLSPEVVLVPTAGEIAAQSTVNLANDIPSSPEASIGVRENTAPPSELERKTTMRSLVERNGIQQKLSLLVLMWLSGVLFLSIHHLAGWIAVERLRKRYVEPAAGQIQHMAAQLQKTLGILRAVQLMHSALVDSPVTIGWLKPVILLPASVLTGLTSRQLEAVLAHELAHIRRHDYLVNLLQTGVETILFYHPAVWWISKQIRIEREHCCDDIAVAVCGDAASFARALAEMEQLRANNGFAMAAKRGSLLERVRRLATKQQATHGSSRDGWWVGVPASLLVMGLVAFQIMPVAQSNPEKKTHKDISRWVETLPSGVEVELIGISTHPSTATSWWKPDETPLTPAPYTDDGSHNYPQETERAYEFAVQLRNLPEDYVSTRMETIPKGSSAGGGSDAENAVLPHTRAVAVTLPKYEDDCVLRVSVAAGKWEPLLDYKKNESTDKWSSSSQNGDKGQFAFAPPLESEGKTVFTLTHSLTQVDFRVVAFDKDGMYRHTIISDSHKVGDLIQTTATFNMDLAKIVRFEIQQRPFEEACFLNIPLKATPPSSLQEIIPERTRSKLNPKYFLSFPLIEDRAPNPEEDALLTRILDAHRQIKDVRVVLTQNSFSLVTRNKDKTLNNPGYLPISDPERLHLPKTDLIVATVAGDLNEKTAQYVRSGEHWWADVSQMMGMPGITQTGFDGKQVWFRFTEIVDIIPATKVNVFHINLAAPMGLKVEDGEARKETVYLGEEEYQGPCHLFAQKSEGCSGNDTLVVNHFYFDKETLLLKKIETFYWIKSVGETPIYIFQVNDYLFSQSPTDFDPALFEPPTEGIIESKEVAFPGSGELTVGLSDASNGNIQASFRLNYSGGSWGSGLN